jgi:cadmium resistance protein CadD (predicted permease)
MLRLVLASLLAFASTNIDDLFVLLVLFAQGRRARTVVAGQYLGFAAIVLTSLVVSAGALLLRPEWVGLLGIAPFAIGVKGLVALRHRRDRDDEQPSLEIGIWPIAAVTFANGGDNIAVYAPLFARRTWLDLAAMLTVFAMMVAVWCAAAHRLVRLPAVATVLERWGHWIAPFVLCGLGIYIFVSEGAATYVLSWLHH